MSICARVLIVLALGLIAANPPQSFLERLSSGMIVSTAHAQLKMRSLLDRLTGEKMPAGIVKTNGRIEATQVDVAAR